MNPTRIHHLFDQRVQEDPDHPFLYLKEGLITMGELSFMVDALESELRQSDVRLGDRVLVVAENCPAHVALILACSRVGAWACGVNARMTASELAGFIAKSDARMVYFTDGVSVAAGRHAQALTTLPSVLPGLLRTHTVATATVQPSVLAESVAAIIFTPRV